MEMMETVIYRKKNNKNKRQNGNSISISVSMDMMKVYQTAAHHDHIVTTIRVEMYK